ncbi:MAG: sugar phosphate nucleotidyltransferase [Candidatus Micrarchaeota archaeon]|nr:sugar phosphate nucleotidyltransferase [Candidatus Micrarchaeota archaeon]
MENSTKVVILCGGEGTRMREETEYVPKPMVKIGGMPILWHIMKIYSAQGYSNFVICLGYKGDMIKQFFLNHELMQNDVTINLGDRGLDVVHKGSGSEDWAITFADTGLKAQTGARIKRIEKYIDGDHFLATYGDGVSDINLAKELEFHKMMGVTATLAGVSPYSKFGIVKSNSQGLVEKFVEKPMLYDYVNGGYYIFNRNIFDFLQADESCILETRPFNALVEKRQMAMYRHDGFWHCMDTYKDYLELNGIWDSGARPWKIQ